MLIKVYVAEAEGIPEYGTTTTLGKRLVAVKFLLPEATEKEKWVYSHSRVYVYIYWYNNETKTLCLPCGMEYNGVERVLHLVLLLLTILYGLSATTAFYIAQYALAHSVYEESSINFA